MKKKKLIEKRKENENFLMKCCKRGYLLKRKKTNGNNKSVVSIIHYNYQFESHIKQARVCLLILSIHDVDIAVIYHSLSPPLLHRYS